MTRLSHDTLNSHDDFKYNDYTKHINWVYHKTQILPKIIFVGENSVSMPLRQYKLRQCELTRLNAPMDAPTAKELFDDRIQRNNFKDLLAEDLKTDEKLRKKYLGTQNVAIVDDYNTVHFFEPLVATVFDCEKFLTPHGRIIYDIPIYRHEHYQSELESAIARIRASTNRVNQMLNGNDRDTHFLIEEIKLSPFGDAAGISGIVIYLKKENGPSVDDPLA